MAWTWHAHADADALAATVAESLRQAVGDALEARGTAVLALAGGGTPQPAYRQLAAKPLDWRRVTLLPGDERCVAHAHPACNLRMLREAFAQADGARFAPLSTTDGDPDASLALARDWLAAHPEPFAAVVLGMGSDGHTASLFPGAAGLAQGLDPASGIDALRIDPLPLPPEAPFPRITLSVARLLRARAIHLLCSGEAKRAVLQQAFDDAALHPVGAILHAPDQVVHVHWSPS